MKKLGLTLIDYAALGIVSMLCAIAFMTICITLTYYMVKIKLWLKPIARRAYQRGALWFAGVRSTLKRIKNDKSQQQIAQ